jgi:hypothetical protein
VLDYIGQNFIMCGRMCRCQRATSSVAITKSHSELPVNAGLHSIDIQRIKSANVLMSTVLQIFFQFSVKDSLSNNFSNSKSDKCDLPIISLFHVFIPRKATIIIRPILIMYFIYAEVRKEL